MLSVFLLGVILFSCEKEPLTDQLKVQPPETDEFAVYAWAWDCPVAGCAGGGWCICNEPQCQLLCDHCGHTLGSRDWSKRTCWTK